MKRDAAMGPPTKRMTRYDYSQGPMGFLAGQIVKEMQRAGYPAKVFHILRSAEKQQEYYTRGTSKAPPWYSAHQYYGAADIIHEQWAWFAADDAPDGKQFWDTLWDCAYVVGEKYDVQFEQRISWDPAHIELVGWESVASSIGERHPTQGEVDRWFKALLPEVWRQRPSAK